MLRRPLILAAAIAVGALAGCGGGSKQHADNPRAQPYSKRSTIGEVVPHVTPEDYGRPIAVYKRYVRRQLRTLLGDAAVLRAAIVRHDLAAARAAWLKADARYESIGAAYGAFGELDAAVNGGPDGLPGGIRNPDFTGLHRIELALWQRRSTPAAAAPTAQLVRDVERLRAAVAKMEIDPLEYSLRAHEILEDGIHLQLSGRASPWSGSALVALRAEVRGTQVVLTTLAPMISPRDSGGALPQARKSLTRLAATLHRLERPDGGLPRWDTLGQRDRELVDGLATGAAEQLAYVPELIDPRPPRPAQRAFGDTG